MGLYEFRREDAERFAQEQRARVRIRGDELEFQKCPYCNGGRSDKYTFSINLTSGAFKCQRASCGAHGNMITIHKDFNFSLGTEADAYYDRSSRKYRNIHRPEKLEVRDPAVKFMETRGISKAVTEMYSITTQKDKPSILVFPFYDENGILQFVKYRNTEFQPGGSGSKEWCEANCKPILFGMDKCDPEQSKTLVMTEGQIDSLSCTEARILNAVSVPTGKNGFTWVPHCWDFLQKFDTLIIFGDHERGEITLLKDMSQRFHGTVKHVREDDYQGCKDANEILLKYGPEAIRDAVNNAEPVEIGNIKRLCDVERKDFSMLEHFETGIKSLDCILGGFYFGQLYILTGERGNGKSTIGSQFMTWAIKAGHSVFFYSGELMDWYFRAWFDQQVAGPNFVNVMRHPSGYSDFVVDADVIPKMAAWYRDKAYLYTRAEVPDENEGLLKVMEKAITQYGCRVLFIDNLMTAIDDDLTSDIYRQQSNFVKELANMAKTMNVMIMLIAHPRKRIGGGFDNDDIAGSSNITNLADVVMRYDRPERKRSRNDEDEDDEDGADRQLTVLKNRVSGRTNRKGIRLYFNDVSKRIAESYDAKSFAWELGWENEEWESSQNAIIPF